MMGQFHHNMDQKGRLIIPAELREDLGLRVVLTRGMDGCVYGYPETEWQKVSAKMKALPLTHKNNRAFVRFFYGAAVVCDFDKQGRVSLSLALRKYASLQKECVIVGMFDHLEIWSKDKWEAFNLQTAQEFDQLAEDIGIDL